MSSRSAKAAPSVRRTFARPKADRYVQCIEGSAPSHMLRNEEAADKASAEARIGGDVTPEIEIKAEASQTKDPLSRSQAPTGLATPRNREIVYEIEITGGNGLAALSGGAVSFDGQGFSIDLNLAPGAQAPAASPQPIVAGLLPAPDSAVNRDSSPRARQDLFPYTDPDFEQMLSEDLGCASLAPRRMPVTRPFVAQSSAASQIPPANAAGQGASAPDEAEAEVESANASANQPKKKSPLGDIVFYAFLIALVVGAFFLSGGAGGGPKMIAGYSAFTVTTGSMHDVLPQGSLIVTKHVEPEELQVGDDITYMISETSSITHRIISIERDVEGTGELAFKTKGTMNDNPDKNLVSAVNVVGKVVFCSYPLGVAIGFVQDNWPLLIFLAVVAAVLFTVLRRILR